MRLYALLATPFFVAVHSLVMQGGPRTNYPTLYLFFLIKD